MTINILWRISACINGRKCQNQNVQKFIEADLRQRKSVITAKG